MMYIMQYGQLMQLYANYMFIKAEHKYSDYTYRAGGLIVTIAANKRNYKQT